MKRFAFTMLELIFVIVIIGILTVLAMPSFNRNPLAEATEQLANHIRYTQHMAMVDDRFDVNDARWYIENWQLEFKRTTSPASIYYEIYSDRNHQGNSDNNESALDPVSAQPLDGNNDITDLTKQFGVTAVSFSASCHAGTSSAIGELSFDNFGRPYYYITGNASDTGQPPSTNMYMYLLKQACTITLTGDGGRTSQVIVEPETGYVRTVIP